MSILLSTEENQGLSSEEIKILLTEFLKQTEYSLAEFIVKFKSHLKYTLNKEDWLEKPLNSNIRKIK